MLSRAVVVRAASAARRSWHASALAQARVLIADGAISPLAGKLFTEHKHTVTHKVMARARTGEGGGGGGGRGRGARVGVGASCTRAARGGVR